MDAPYIGALVRLAATQRGLVTAAQADAIGVGPARRHRAVRSGLLLRRHPAVYQVAAAEFDWQAAVFAACLQAGPLAVASHEAACWMHGLDRLVPFAPVVTLPPGGRAAHTGFRVHRLCDLVGEHRSDVRGVAVTTVARTVVDLSSVVGRRRLAWILDELTIVERRVTLGGVSRCLRQVNRRGRRGIRNLQVLLDARVGGRVVPRSRLERWVDELLERSRLPAPEMEYPLPGAAPGTGFVDRAWPEARLGLEVDGRPWHAREASMARDRARDRSAAAEGWQVLRVLGEEARDSPAAVIADLERSYDSRMQMLG